MVRAATVGVAEHASSAVLGTLSPNGELLDRRNVELIERGLPSHPHHHQGSWAVGRYLNTPGARPIRLAEAVALVDRVRDATTRGARDRLAELADAVRVPIVAISIRVCPAPPATTEDRIRDNRAQTVADSVMYREALAAAAKARGWSVHWYDRDQVLRETGQSVSSIGRAVGPPWQAKHKLAAAAALAAQRTG